MVLAALTATSSESGRPVPPKLLRQACAEFLPSNPESARKAFRRAMLALDRAGLIERTAQGVAPRVIEQVTLPQGAVPIYVRREDLPAVLAAISRASK
jgi:hypothetical protein